MRFWVCVGFEAAPVRTSSANIEPGSRMIGWSFKGGCHTFLEHDASSDKYL